MTFGNNRVTKNERRDAAREKARLLRESQRKKERRRRWGIQGGIIVAVLAIAAIVAVVVTNSVVPPSAGPVNMASDGILIGKGDKAVRTASIPVGGKPTATVRDKKSSVISIRIYLDYFCPICNEFETANKAQISALLKSGAATVEIHPISFLDRSSLGTKYSTRSAEAAGCVSTYAPDDFWAWTQEMYVKQPAEGTVGLTNAQIMGVAKTAGVHNIDKITSCLNSKRYEGWVASATDRATTGPLPDSNVKTVTGTPTVIVDGLQYSASDWTSASDFQAFIIQAASAANNAGTSTSTPTPTATPSPTPTKKK